MSIILEVEGVRYTISSPQLSLRGDTLLFVPSIPFTNGQVVDVALVAASDVYGYTLSTPLSFSFTVDLSPPEISLIVPASEALSLIRWQLLLFH
jgi:hypothetical protein